jgi:outer membrane protein OmpA-like peptidoglycan-associated protein
MAIPAERSSAQDIIRALKPQRLTRGLTTSPTDGTRVAEQDRFIDGLRNRPTRSLTTDERQQIASIARSRPQIDLEINFEFNSAVIELNGMAQAAALGEALTGTELNGSTFIIAGHTDSKGSETYNQGLSERRADAVRRFLTERYEIDADRLVTVGYGESQLKNQANPFAGENRRVQVVNATGD